MPHPELLTGLSAVAGAYDALFCDIWGVLHNGRQHFPPAYDAITRFKAERGPVAIEAIRDAKSAYLMAVGGAAYLVARAIKGARVVGFEDLGMEAIYEFDVKDMPVTVAVDSEGVSVHHTGPLVWREKIAREKLLERA